MILDTNTVHYGQILKLTVNLKMILDTSKNPYCTSVIILELSVGFSV